MNIFQELITPSFKYRNSEFYEIERNSPSGILSKPSISRAASYAPKFWPSRFIGRRIFAQEVKSWLFRWRISFEEKLWRGAKFFCRLSGRWIFVEEIILRPEMILGCDDNIILLIFNYLQSFLISSSISSLLVLGIFLKESSERFRGSWPDSK